MRKHYNTGIRTHMNEKAQLNLSNTYRKVASDFDAVLMLSLKILYSSIIAFRILHVLLISAIRNVLVLGRALERI